MGILFLKPSTYSPLSSHSTFNFSDLRDTTRNNTSIEKSVNNDPYAKYESYQPQILDQRVVYKYDDTEFGNLFYAFTFSL